MAFQTGVCLALLPQPNLILSDIGRQRRLLVTTFDEKKKKKKLKL